MSPNLIDIAREKAQAVLERNGSAIGLLGSSQAYKQVWARDSMICGLGLMLAEEGRAVHRASLRTLQTYQSPLGNIPHNVGFTGIPDPALIAHGGALHVGEDAPKVVVDTAHAGCIDNSLWFILGNYYTFRTDGDLDRLRSAWAAIKRAHIWLRYQDSNECGLLEVHEAMDWADLFAYRYNSLWPNVLWFAVHKALAAMAEPMGEDPELYRATAGDIRFKINTLLWIGPEITKDMAWVEANRKEWLYPIRLTVTHLQERPFYLPYMAFRDYCDRFETFGNLIAILFGVASPEQTARIFDYITWAGVDEPHPIKAAHPPVMPGEPDWREYYRLRNLNQPNQYHNGGIWPFIGGFYVAALVKAGRLNEAARQLQRLARMNQMSRAGGEWDFNEWFHGVSGKPSGFAGQSWSAAMYIYAHECVRRGECLVFNAAEGW
jgi:glycogen debranching enzyme